MFLTYVFRFNPDKYIHNGDLFICISKFLWWEHEFYGAYVDKYCNDKQFKKLGTENIYTEDSYILKNIQILISVVK